jgi:hypothetical protein
MAERKLDEICEIECLNLDDLDVEELERRLEMSVAPHLEECTSDSGGGGGGCGTNCSTNICVALCTNLCGCNSLDVCGIDIW